MERINNVLGKTQRYQLSRTVFQALPDVILVDIKFQRKISFDGKTLTITRRVGTRMSYLPCKFRMLPLEESRKQTKKRQKTENKQKKKKDKDQKTAKGKNSPFQGY